MLISSIFAFLHHFFAFSLAATLTYEFIAYHQELTLPEIRCIQGADITYGISVGSLLVVGLLRVFFFEKGAAFYAANPFFWVKMGAFLLIGLLSINPTVRFLRWNKTLRVDRLP